MQNRPDSLAPNCPRCGQANRAGSRFCKNCAAELAAPAPRPSAVRICPRCAKPLSTSAEFCGHCGNGLRGRSRSTLAFRGGAAVIALAAVAVGAYVWVSAGRSPESEKIYLPSFQGLGLIELDVAAQGARRVAKTALFNNSFVAWNPHRQEFYVAAINGDAISVIRAEPFREVATMKEGVGWNTFSMALAADGQTLSVVCSGASGTNATRVLSFDTSSRKLLATTVLAPSLVRALLAPAPNGRSLFVNWGGMLDEYDARQLKLLNRDHNDFWSGATGLAVSADGLSVYLTRPGGLLRWRTDRKAVDARLQLPEKNVANPAISPDGQHVFVAGLTAIYRVPASLDGFRGIKPPKPMQNSPFDFAVAADGRSLYATSGSNAMESLWMIDIESQSVTRTVENVPYPSAVSVASILRAR